MEIDLVPEPFKVIRQDATGPFVIVCDHASKYIPPELEQLGLSGGDLERHIAWDIGAAGIAEILSERFDSPAVFCGTSRLVIDCNRQLAARDLIPEVSDGSVIPRNRNLSPVERQARLDAYFHPYHDAVERVLAASGEATFLSIHSMTDCMRGTLRPWPISFSSYQDRMLVEPLLLELREYNVGDNQPYDLDPAVDYSTPYHAIRRGMRHLQVEFRQDEIADSAGQVKWAEILAGAIRKAGILSSGLR